MATTENIVLGDGGNTYSFSFPYLKTEDVRAELQEFDASQPVGSQVISTDDTAAFTINPSNPTQIIFSAVNADTVYQIAPDEVAGTPGGVRITSTNNYPVRVRIYRSTQPDSTPATFFAGSAIRAQDLNDNFDQILYIMQENENELISITTGGIGDNAISTASLQNNSVTSAKIADGTIVDDDVNASAAIAGTKISPNFGAQNTVTTGNNTAASFIPTSNTAPTNGLYLPSANNVALATNNTGVLFISSDGNVGLNESDPSSYSLYANNLVIKDPGNTGISIISSTTAAGTIYFGDTDSENKGGITYYHALDNLAIITNSNSRLVIDSIGSVKIKGSSSNIFLNPAISFNGSAPVDSLIVDSSGDVHIGNDLIVNNLNGGQLAGSRNRIINGDMRIAQRGTSFAAIAAGAYSLDRWLWGHAGTMVCTVSQDTDVPNNTFQSSLKVDVTTADTSIAAGDYVHIVERIEGYNVRDLIGTTFTLSFWVKSPKTGTHCVSFRNAGPIDRSYVKEYTVSTANTWEYKTLTVSGGLITAGNWDWTNGTGLDVCFTLASGTTFQTTADAWQTGNFIATANQVNVMDSTANDFYITGVQLEPGTIATPFERRSYGDELALCQRYYQNTIRIQMGGVTSLGVSLYSAVQLPVTTRDAPTLTQLSLSLVGSCTAISVDTVTKDYIDFSASNTSGGAGIASAVYSASAEL